MTPVAAGRAGAPARHPGALVGYLTALAVGLGPLLWVFPHWALVGALPPGAPARPDFGANVIGQLYFFSQPWRLSGLTSFLVNQRLEAPWGASVALNDSIPLLTVASKLLRPVLPPFEQTITLYQAGAWLLQPVAAVFALRSAGERRWLPALALAIMASSMPSLLFRLWHAALTGHCFLLAMLGLSLRIVRGSRAALASASVLQVALLLIHPYLMLIASVQLLAAPLTLFLRHDPGWRTSLVACAVSTVATLLVGQLLGYWGAPSDGGFGYYSMNLLGPFWPTFSALIPDVRFAPADGTGGQADGYQYLGLGLLGLLAVSALGWRIWKAGIGRHPGLALTCAGLSALAVTNWVFFLHHKVLHVPFPSRLLAQARGSGRLFWAVSYTLMLAAAIVVLRRFPRAGPAILLLASLVQFEDAQQLRRIDRNDLRVPGAYPFADGQLSAILRAHQRLTVVPTFPCNGGGIPVNEDLVWAASRTRMEINSIYMARQANPQPCLPQEAITARPQPGEVRVILPGFHQALMAFPEADDDCRVLSPYVVCTRKRELLAGLPGAVVRPVPADVPLPLGPGTAGASVLLAGWSAPSPGGVWSVARSSFLGARLDKAAPGDVVITIRAAAMPVPGRWGTASLRRPVEVWAGPRHVADWIIGPAASDFEARVPAAWTRQKRAAIIELRTAPLASALDLGRSTDPRRFGIWLESVRFGSTP